jgi:hypothetical protein
LALLPGVTSGGAFPFPRTDGIVAPAMIRSIRVILCRTLLRVLDDRGIGIHAVAQSIFISIVDLRRLLEFGSPLEPQAAERLIAWGTRMVVASQPKKHVTHPNRISGERVRIA